MPDVGGDEICGGLFATDESCRLAAGSCIRIHEADVYEEGRRAEEGRVYARYGLCEGAALGGGEEVGMAEGDEVEGHYARFDIERAG